MRAQPKSGTLGAPVLGFRGLGSTCNRKDLPFLGTIYRNHNKES